MTRLNGPHRLLQWLAIALATLSPFAIIGFLLSIEGRLTRLETQAEFIAERVSPGILPDAETRVTILEQFMERHESVPHR